MRLGAPGLVVLGILQAFVPIPGGLDVLLVLFSGHNRDLWWYYATLALTGDMTGAYLNYRVARKGGKEAIEKRLPRETTRRAFSKFEKFGGSTLLLGAWMPPPMPWIPFLAAAGAMKYPIRKFLAVLLVGRGSRYFALAWVSQQYGGWIVGSFREKLLHTVLVLLLVAAAVGITLYVRYSRRRQKHSAGRQKTVEQSPASVESIREGAARGRKAG
ncbi:MAG: YqaA family protein [Candidatus Korobacteraceae bacterium]